MNVPSIDQGETRTGVAGHSASASAEEGDWGPKSLLFLGVLGMLVSIVGSLLSDSPAQKWCFLSSACLMTPLPLWRGDTFLGALQIVSLAGAFAGVAPLGDLLTAAIPLAIATGALAFLWWQNAMDHRYQWIGAAGVIVLAVGYATRWEVVYLGGGILLTVYTAISFRRGCKVALLWCILNAVFVVTSSIAVLAIDFPWR